MVAHLEELIKLMLLLQVLLLIFLKLMFLKKLMMLTLNVHNKQRKQVNFLQMKRRKKIPLVMKEKLIKQQLIPLLLQQ